MNERIGYLPINYRIRPIYKDDEGIYYFATKDKVYLSEEEIKMSSIFRVKYAKSHTKRRRSTSA